ncbi:MAG: hypothetical protein VR72_04730 [Clostridiaceae bacterium BRH_c20a]|nr:MAG: hypothetical protein VR72_04730 [Clostridiaceae bacterium BRH_c20a]
MSKVLKKSLLLSIILIIGLVFIAACGNTQDNNVQEKEKAPENKQVEEKKEVDFPKRNINISIPFGAGGGTDQVGRILAGLAEKNSGVNWVCTNDIGGAGALAMGNIAKSTPDGYNLLFITSNISVLKHMGHTELNYENFEPIIAVNTDPAALIVRSDSGWNTLEDFIAAAKEKRLKVQTGAAGGLWQVGALAMKNALNLDLNIIPSGTGGAPAAPALLGKQVDAIAIAPNEALSGLKTGEFKVLVSLGRDRSALGPDAPTMVELGYPDITAQAVRAFYAPKGTPPEVVKKLHDMLKAAVESKEYPEYMESTGSTVNYMNTEDLVKYLEWEFEAYKKLLAFAGL